MNESTKEQIKFIRRAARVAFPSMGESFTDYEFIAAVKSVMGHGYVSESSIMRRLRELFTGMYRYDREEKKYYKTEQAIAA